MPKKVFISCNVCGADAFQKLSTYDDWNIGRCRKCGLIYVNPIPVFEPTDEFSEVSKGFTYTQFQHQPITDDIIQFDKAQLKNNLEEISQLTNQRFDTVRFLDVGCGSGASVRAANDLGWEATGIDIDKELIESGRKQLGVDLRCSSLLESKLKGNYYHFIRLRDVIEHLPNPFEILTEIKRLLVPGGVALFSTPNEDGLLTQLRIMLKGKRDTVATVPPPHHIHGFRPKTLKRIFDRVGLKTYMLKTTIPVDPLYVTARNIKDANRKMHVLAWQAANAIGKGSMLVGWVGK